MKLIKNIKKSAFAFAIVFTAVSCVEELDSLPENVDFTEDTDYTDATEMIKFLAGAYGKVYERGWEQPPLISVRGDDVNAGGLGDQQPFTDTDNFIYDKDYWMYNSLWQTLYSDVFAVHSAIEQIEKFKEFANSNEIAQANQYIAEAKTLRAWMLFQLSRVWGDVYITYTSDPSDLLTEEVSSKAEVMQHISDQMDEAIADLPEVRPNERIDIRGGVTAYTAMAMKALANLELENYQVVADVTGDIINSGKFSLFPDFYELFKTDGKLSNENLFELQYSDFGQGSGEVEIHDFVFYGPQVWTPAVEGAAAGWGFYEPSMKFIKFMLDRNETVRLETSVLFTDRGIDEIQTDPDYSTLPAFVSNTTRDGDVINDYARALFASGKHYLPSNQLTPGRTVYGTNKNYIVIRYAEILLMYAEALTQGASGSGMTADEAVNEVRSRAGLTPLSGVTTAQVMDEKFAELGLEWGIRYYDMIRLGQTGELSYDGRSFSVDKTYLPYPQAQVDQLPNLENN